MIPVGSLRRDGVSFRIQPRMSESCNFSVAWKFSRKQRRGSIPSPTSRRQAEKRDIFQRKPQGLAPSCLPAPIRSHGKAPKGRLCPFASGCGSPSRHEWAHQGQNALISPLFWAMLRPSSSCQGSARAGIGGKHDRLF